MFDSHALFKERLSAHIKELSRYLRYIFNGHLAVAMFFLISALAVYYQQWLKQLPEDFPASWIIGILFGLLASYAPIRTLLQKPDLVFLIAAEDNMTAYFRNTLLYSYVMQLYLVFLVAAALGPLYFHAYPNEGSFQYLLLIALILFFKGWNLIANWWMLKVHDKSVKQIDQITRFALTITIFYFIVSGNKLFAGMVTILFIGVFLYILQYSRQQSGLAWEQLVEKDQNRMQLFYRIANLFTDVPHLKSPIKKRRLLASIVSKLPLANKHTYDYLYRITFIRSGDYLGMYIRLIVVGGLFIYFVPNEWMKLLFGFLFLYMSSFQMMTLYHHYRTNIWLDIYPVLDEYKTKAIVKWLINLAIIQTVIYSLVLLAIFNYLGFLIMLAGGILFTYLFVNGYIKKKIAS